MMQVSHGMDGTKRKKPTHVFKKVSDQTQTRWFCPGIRLTDTELYQTYSYSSVWQAAQELQQCPPTVTSH